MMADAAGTLKTGTNRLPEIESAQVKKETIMASHQRNKNY
jgi:hypothetical protein